MVMCDMDGFENGAVNLPGTVGLASVVTGRDGTGLAAKSGQNASMIKYFTVGSDTIYFHFGWYYTTEMTSNMHQAYYGIFYDVNGTPHITLATDGAGRMTVYRGDDFGTYILTSTYMFPSTPAWHSIEGKLLIADSGGNLTIKVDGVEIINYTGDTRNGGSSTRPGAWMCRANGFNSNAVDDWCVFDTTGSVNNSWTGEISIQGLRVSGNGAFSELVGSDGNSTDNYLLVDEVPYNTTDYVGSVTTLAKDTYDFANLIKTGNVLAVTAHAYAAKSDAGPKFGRILMRGGSGGLVETADLPLSTTFLPISSPIWLTDGDGNPWNIARVNASQFGFKVI